MITYKINSYLKQDFQILFEKTTKKNPNHSCFTLCSLGVGKINSNTRELSQRHNIELDFLFFQYRQNKTPPGTQNQPERKTCNIILNEDTSAWINILLYKRDFAQEGCFLQYLNIHTNVRFLTGILLRGGFEGEVPGFTTAVAMLLDAEI